VGLRQTVAETYSHYERYRFVTEEGERVRETATAAERNTQMSDSPMFE